VPDEFFSQKGFCGMREVSIREFRRNMAKELGDLPFMLTRNGEILGVVWASHGRLM